MTQLKGLQKDDYENYKTFVKSRQYLFESDLNLELEHIFSLLHIFSKFESDVANIDAKSKLKNFYNEVKNNLLIGFDLINMNYINSGKQVLRSSIEAFFRFILTLSRYIEYRDNKKRGIYTATQTLKELKSLCDSHGVWKLTSYSVNYFNNSPINDSINRLNETYGKLSGHVHVNTKDNFSLHEYLTEYSFYDYAKSQEAISVLNFLLEDILLVCYYFSYKLTDEQFHFERVDVRYFETNAQGFTRSTLDNIDRYFQ